MSTPVPRFVTLADGSKVPALAFGTGQLPFLNDRVLGASDHANELHLYMQELRSTLVTRLL